MRLIFFLIFLALLVFLTSCTFTEVKKLSNKDIELARCVCQRDGKELRAVKRLSNKVFSFTCKDGDTYHHEDDSYTEGCTK